MVVIMVVKDDGDDVAGYDGHSDIKVIVTMSACVLFYPFIILVPS